MAVVVVDAASECAVPTFCRQDLTCLYKAYICSLALLSRLTLVCPLMCSAARENFAARAVSAVTAATALDMQPLPSPASPLSSLPLPLLDSHDDGEDGGGSCRCHCVDEAVAAMSKMTEMSAPSANQSVSEAVGETSI